MTTFELSARLFLQIAFILAACRGVGWVGRRYLRQTQVVGEMIAGVLLGPSFLGGLVPGWQAGLFPKESMGVLFAASQLGLGLSMFVVGTEFRLDLVRARARGAAGVSLAGIAVPFALGAALALGLVRRSDLFAPGLPALGASLFLGAAMSITAFPMLARIIFERGLTGTRLGALALAAGAIDDVVAWMVLAVVLALFPGAAAPGSGDLLRQLLAAAGLAPNPALLAIGGGAAYVLVVVLLGRPLLRRIAAGGAGAAPDATAFSGVLILLMLGCWFTDAIGLYAVFGAFVLGAAVPRGPFAPELVRRVEPLTTNLLLPLFFVYSGLNTRLGLVNSPVLWAITAAVLLAAVLGKGGACYLAARAGGESRADALGIGTLMNARGLMELIILNIGLQRGLITPTLFTVMVIMAVTTTVMTGPLCEALGLVRAAPVRPALPREGETAAGAADGRRAAGSTAPATGTATPAALP